MHMADVSTGELTYFLGRRHGAALEDRSKVYSQHPNTSAALNMQSVH